MTEQNQNSPDYISLAYQQMAPAWALIEDVSGGQDAIKSQQRVYLPQEPAEKDEMYQRRLQRSLWCDHFNPTVEALTGMIFNKSPQLGDDVPQAIKSDLENIDLSGTHWAVFAQEVADAALRFGHTFIVVDYPQALPENATAADERAAGRRPFWLHYLPQQAINWRIQNVQGQQALTRITFRETILEPFGEFGEQEITQWRVWYLNEAGRAAWQLFRATTGLDHTTAILDAGSGVTSLRRLPVVPVYGHKKGFLLSAPPLKPLADLNVTHYQSESDQRNILHVTRVPILAIIGTEIEELTVGANSIQNLPEPGSDMKWVEHSGASIGAGRQDVLDLEARMLQFGLGMLAPDGARSQVTATQSLIEGTAQTSKLTRLARSLHDGLEAALSLHAEYRSLAQGGSISFSDNYLGLTLDPALLAQLVQMVRDDQLPVQTVWQIMLKFGQLPDDFDPEQALALILENKKKLSAAMPVQPAAPVGGPLPARRDALPPAPTPAA
ncbi:MAG TPA: DUF4055 domain-containing protein [Blastocatellia bacterium]|nr:DUF4055 domain-containing protein [Blastocatellia bacterium]